MLFRNVAQHYYSLVLQRVPKPSPGPFSRTDFKKIPEVPRIDSMVMAPVSMMHWDPIGMGVWHMYELEAYVYVYWHDAYILCHLSNFSQVK